MQLKKALYRGSLLVFTLISLCAFTSTLEARFGSYTFIWQVTTAPTGSYVIITAEAENGVTFYDSITVAGLTQTQAAANCSTALHNAGWDVSRNPPGTGNSVTITGRLAGSPVKKVDGRSGGSIWIDMVKDGDCTLAAAMPGDRNWKYAFGNPPADPLSPGVLALALNNYHMQAPLPPGAPPSVCTQLLMQSMQQAGFIVTLHGADTINLNWEDPINMAMLGQSVYTTLSNPGGVGGPHSMIGLPTSLPQAPQALDVTMTPLNPPILIPANGGQFQFNASVQRVLPPQAPFYAWARDRFPNGTYTSNLLGPVQINPPVGVTVTRQRTQVVPSLWQAGLHWYIGYAHTAVSYPATDADSFAWTKSTVADGGATVWEASNYGEEFPYQVKDNRTPTEFALIGASPNPFNPTTTISYQISASNHVSLKVYDTAGRLVATLVNGWRDAGAHQVTFDGSNLASGVYLYSLTAGSNHAIGKIVLMK